MEELKPCPFCGNEAHLVEDSGHYVECRYCFANTGVCGCEEVAVVAWNRRKERTCRIVDIRDYNRSRRDFSLSCGHVKHGLRGYHFEYCDTCGARVENAY